MSEQFGPYRLEDVIGRGGAGEVHRATDLARNRVVALKRLAPRLAEDDVYQARFRREARLAAGMSSPHVIPVYDFGEINGRLFLTMPLIAGKDAAVLLREEGPLPPQRAVEIVSQAADALDAAHAAGLVHRDVKPSNLLITGSVRDFVYLVDFGIARNLVKEETALTEAGHAVGTLDYMAPESFDGRSGHRADIYSLACVLFELLTGHRPFQADSAAALIYAHLRRPPPLPSSMRQGLPQAFDAIVARGMAKDPQDRFATASDLADAAWMALPPGPPRTGQLPALSRPPAAPGPPTPRAWPPAASGPLTPAAGPSRSGSSGARSRNVILVGAAAVLAAASVYAATHAAARSSPTPTSQPDSAAAALVPVPPTVVDTVALNGYGHNDAVSPDGRLVYATGGNDVSAIATATNTVVARIHVGGIPLALTFSHDGGTVYVATLEPPAVSIVDVAKQAVVATLATSPLYGLAVSPDGTRLYGATLDADVLTVIDPADRKVLTTVPVGDGPTSVVVSPDGRFAYVADGESRSVSVVDLATNTTTGSIPVGARPEHLALTPDGQQLYVVNFDSMTVSIVDTRSRQSVSTIVMTGQPRDVVVGGGGRWAYVTNEQVGSASVIDTTKRAVVAAVPFGSSPGAVALSPDGRRAYVLNTSEPTMSVLAIAR
ncbi:MAG TPA: serine/threonine-protein kinase [Pseudonocardia sp.]